MRKAMKMMLAVLMIAVLLTGAASAAAYKANVITSSMKVYDSSLNYLGSLPQGTPFYVTDISDSGNWAKVYYNGRTGFARMQNILFEHRIPAVCVQDTSMRFVTKTSFKLKLAFNATVAAGTPVYVVGYYNGYLLIENASGNGLGVVRADCFRRV